MINCPLRYPPAGPNMIKFPVRGFSSGANMIKCPLQLVPYQIISPLAVKHPESSVAQIKVSNYNLVTLLLTSE